MKQLSVAMAVLVCTSSAWAAGERVIASPLSPRDIATYGLPAGTTAASGLWNVGVGETIHMEAQVDKDDVVTDVTWEIVSKPDDSLLAAVGAAAMTPDMPIYSIEAQADYIVADRATLVPDVIGLYEIKATITTESDGAVEVTVLASAGNYVGVGTVGDETPVTPQCGVCHVLDDRIEPWQGTGHATFLERSLSGETSDHYAGYCVSCHTVGYNATAGADNGGFDDVAAAENWSIPLDGDGHPILDPSTWEDMPQSLKTKSNIQCENCHGPGSEHSGDKRASDVSYDVGMCAVCHDSGSHHVRPTEWKSSPHSVKPVRSGSCGRCHTGDGFIAYVNDDDVRAGESQAIGCAACHDPHSAENEHQVRTTQDVELFNGEMVEDGGLGKLCMNCHISRRDAEEYVTENHSHYGPHYGPQTDMVVGTNAVQYGQYIPSSSGHLLAVEDSCATCHMQTLEGDNPAVSGGIHGAGSHTFKMVWDGGTPDDPSDDVEQAGVCSTCHGEQEDFDLLTRKDYDGDGVAEGIQTEVNDLLTTLAKMLPPLHVAEVDDPTDDYTQAQLAAVYNYLFVEEDGSHGVHNPQYATGILKASIADLGGTSEVAGTLGGESAGGGWIMSDWFGYYAPIFDGNWIFHQYHGPLYVSPAQDEFVQLWDPVIGSWLLTSAELYPTLLIWDTQQWVSFSSGDGGMREFYDAEADTTLYYPGFTFDPNDMTP